MLKNCVCVAAAVVGLMVAAAVRADADFSAGPAVLVPTGNFLTATQYQLGVTAVVYDAKAPSAARQTTTAWQVHHGSWNGQALAGLSLVLVQESPEDPAVAMNPASAAVRFTLYVSEGANPAQRSAALDAVVASHPELFPAGARPAVRVEPAVIRIERPAGADGEERPVVLHVAAIT